MESSSNNSNLFKQRRSYTKVVDPFQREMSSQRNKRWCIEHPDKKKIANLNFRLNNPDYYDEYRYRKHVEKYGHDVPLPPKRSNISMFEQTWINIVNLEFSEFEFVKIRPNWLKNPVTEYNLELDLYCDELKLAIEISGDQHFHFISRFHKDYDDFLYQQYKDKFKTDRCKDLGIELIVVTKNDIPSEIIQQISWYIIKHETDRIQSIISQSRPKSF